MTETTQRTPVSAERLRSRTPVKELIYVQLSEAEGGLALNIGENGVGIRVSGVLKADFFPLIRLRLPDAENWIETSARLAWSNKETRAAGIEFIDLPETSAEQIKRWMASQIAGGNQPGASVGPANGGSRGARAPSRSVAGASTPAPSAPRRQRTPVRENPAVEGTPSDSAGGPARYMTRDGYATNYSPYIPVSAAKPRRWGTIVILVGLVAALSFLAGILLGPPGRSVPLRGAGVGVAESGAAADAPSTNSTGPVESPSPSSTVIDPAANAPVSSPPDATLPGDQAGNATAADAAASSPAAKNATPNGVGERVASSSRQQKTPVASEKKPAEQLASKKPRAQPSVDSAVSAVSRQAGTQEKDDSANVRQRVSTDSAATDVANNTLNRATSQNTAAPPASANALSATSQSSGANSPQAAPPSGSVTFTSRFLSIKLTPELSAQPSKLAGSLQIGQLFSTTQPSYPADAARQGVQGVVKLRATVGPDGSVQSANVVSGPEELDAAAIKAVLGWKYGPTMLGNQPVGAVHDVTLTFKLSNSPADQR